MAGRAREAPYAKIQFSRIGVCVVAYATSHFPIGIKLQDYQWCNLIPICQFPSISVYGAYSTYTAIYGGRISGFGRFLRFNVFLISVHRFI